jgi:hypothetical protein
MEWPGDSRAININSLGIQLIYQEQVISCVRIYGGSYEIPLQLILLRQSREQSPTAILLTNAEPDQMNAQAVVERYVWRWPHLVNGVGIHLVKESYLRKDSLLTKGPAFKYKNFIDNYAREVLAKNGTLLNLTKGIFQLLRAYCQIRFFNFDTCDNSDQGGNMKIYELKGYVCPANAFLKVGFRISDPLGDSQDSLKLAKIRVNEGEIFNPRGQRLLLE